jgi:segregation and condensation protein B
MTTDDGPASTSAAVNVVDITVDTGNPGDLVKPVLDPATVRAQLEALLVVAEGGVGAVDLASAVGLSVPRIEEELHTLAREYEARGSGIRIRDTAAGWRLFAASEHHELIRAALRDDQPSRLTQAALETLAVIAYRQPVSRSRIGAIRGVSADAVVRTLVSRGLVVETGTEEGSGAVLYGTSVSFLEKLGLRSLAELPPLSDHLPDLQDVLSSADVTSM